MVCAEVLESPEAAIWRLLGVSDALEPEHREPGGNVSAQTHLPQPIEVWLL